MKYKHENPVNAILRKLFWMKIRRRIFDWSIISIAVGLPVYVIVHFVMKFW